MKFLDSSLITSGGLALALAAPGGAQTTARVSVGTSGVQGDSTSGTPALSADGRLVAFTSVASNLVPGDTNGSTDVFVRDRRASVTVRVSLDSFGGEADGDSLDCTLSADGRFVAFTSRASNLVPGDTNAARDVFVRDLSTGTTTRVSVDSLGAQGDHDSLDPSLSADGRFVAFTSVASNLVPDDTHPLPVHDVFVHDRVTGVTLCASVDSLGVQAEGLSWNPSISDDGSRVAFSSNAPNLVPHDMNSTDDIFVRDLVKATTVRVSVGTGRTEANLASNTGVISGNGRFVAFDSWAFNLVPGDTNGVADVFIHDLETGITTRDSLSYTDDQVFQPNQHPALSRDGRLVVFSSSGGALVEGDTNRVTDVFVRDRLFGTTTRVSIGSHGQEALGASSGSSISADGSHVGFVSHAPNLVRMDTNQVPDTFVHSLARMNVR